MFALYPFVLIQFIVLLKYICQPSQEQSAFGSATDKKAGYMAQCFALFTYIPYTRERCMNSAVFKVPGANGR